MKNSPTLKELSAPAFSKILRLNFSHLFFRRIALLPGRLKRYIFFSNDLIIFIVAIYIALSLRFEDSSVTEQIALYSSTIVLVIPVKFCIFYLTGMYHSLLRHTGVEIFGLALKAVVISEGALTALCAVLQFRPLPRSVQIISALVTWVLVVGIRFVMNHLLNRIETPAPVRSRTSPPWSQPQRLIIYGAGAAGSQIFQALSREHTYDIVAFVDDNSAVQGRLVNGLRIYHPDLLTTLVPRYKVKMVLLAVPSATPQDKRRILDSLKGLPIEVKTLPTVAEILTGKVSIGQIRNVDIADLLGREEVLPDPELLQVDIVGKSVLVTGAGGSIGSELCRQIAQQNPKMLVLFELNEFALYSIDIELAEAYPQIARAACLGSVTDAERLEEVFTEYQVETVYHAAAYKHVPLVEANSAQGIINNVYGTLTAARTANKCRASTFVLISTDKAVRPTNVMGATKRSAELVLQALAAQSNTYTRFIMVRFGNVLGSNGSVVPRFRKQIAEGKPITLTHPDITRYFMSIPEASRLVIQAGAMGKGGEVFLLEMGEPVRIYDLATQMIELSGLVPGEDIDIQLTGLRPGEKLYEELLISGKNAIETDHPKIYAAREDMIPWRELEPLLNKLFLAANQKDGMAIRSILKTLVPGYKPQQHNAMVAK
jgi:FlaA1/EpsC-like NDP-sugar epimerase